MKACWLAATTLASAPSAVGVPGARTPPAAVTGSATTAETVPFGWWQDRKASARPVPASRAITSSSTARAPLTTAPPPTICTMLPSPHGDRYACWIHVTPASRSRAGAGSVVVVDAAEAVDLGAMGVGLTGTAVAVVVLVLTVLDVGAAAANEAAPVTATTATTATAMGPRDPERPSGNMSAEVTERAD